MDFLQLTMWSSQWLRIWFDRRFRADLQGHRSSEFRPGRFHDAGCVCVHWVHQPRTGKFWLAVPLSILVMGALGYLFNWGILRHMFGQSQTSVVILTIAMGFIIRFFAGAIWSHEPTSLETPFAGQEVRSGGLVLGIDEVLIVVLTAILTFVFFLFFSRTRIGLAMQAASQNQLAAYYMGIAVHRYSLVWGLSGMVAAVAGILFVPVGRSTRRQVCWGSKPLQQRQSAVWLAARCLAGRADHRIG